MLINNAMCDKYLSTKIMYHTSDRYCFYFWQFQKIGTRKALCIFIFEDLNEDATIRAAINLLDYLPTYVLKNIFRMPGTLCGGI